MELESAADEEELRMDDFGRRESRLSGELFAAGLETHWRKVHPNAPLGSFFGHGGVAAERVRRLAAG